EAEVESGGWLTGKPQSEKDVTLPYWNDCLGSRAGETCRLGSAKLRRKLPFLKPPADRRTRWALGLAEPRLRLVHDQQLAGFTQDRRLTNSCASVEARHRRPDESRDFRRDPGKDDYR